MDLIVGALLISVQNIDLFIFYEHLKKLNADVASGLTIPIQLVP